MTWKGTKSASPVMAPYLPIIPYVWGFLSMVLKTTIVGWFDNKRAFPGRTSGFRDSMKGTASGGRSVGDEG